MQKADRARAGASEALPEQEEPTVRGLLKKVPTTTEESVAYALVKEQLAGTTVVSTGHRPTLGAFHTRRLVVRPNGDQAATLEEAKATT